MDDQDFENIEITLEDLDMSSRFSKLIFAYIMTLLIAFNIDHGSVPAALTDI